MLTDHYPKVTLAHTPTPLESLDNLSTLLDGPRIWVKRDDCTGLAMGGNKVRQLEYYIGDALDKGADTLLTTGAVQSNHVRLTIAAARKLGLDIEVQLEERVSGRQPAYYDSGNPYLMKLMGAKIHHYPVGEDEFGADNALYERAKALEQQGARPYVIPLAGNHIPLGSLGYVECAEELILQCQQRLLDFDGIVLASGGGGTHAGLLCGLRALGVETPVYGFCVRRNQAAQYERVRQRVDVVSEMIGHDTPIDNQDIRLSDATFAPGYGHPGDKVIEALYLVAREEGLLLDPTYTGKAFAGLIRLVRKAEFKASENLLFLHTGGIPGLFGYPEVLDPTRGFQTPPLGAE